jgi:hypothetical protein
VTFKSLAEYREAYLILTKEIVCYQKRLEQNIDLLNEIFGIAIIVPLSDLLPSTKELKNPPEIPF